MANGKLTFVKSAACPNGPPKGGVWFPVSVTVHGQDAQMYHSGVLVTSIKSHFAPKAWGGVFAYNSYKNVILFRKFQTAPVIYVSKRCKQVNELPGYTKLDADYGKWPQDAFCQVTYMNDGGSSNYQLSVDMYNFIGRDGINFGHLECFLTQKIKTTMISSISGLKKCIFVNVLVKVTFQGK